MSADIIGFGLLLIVQFLAFFFLHGAALRFFFRRHLLPVLTTLALISTGAVSAGAFLFSGALFSSAETRVLAILGSATTTLFAAGLYAFLGPITADRSCASQLLQFMLTRPEGADRDTLRDSFDPHGFIDKRIIECLDGGLIREESGTFVLTPRGVRVAKGYRVLLHGLAIEAMEEYRPYFRKAGDTPPPPNAS